MTLAQQLDQLIQQGPKYGINTMVMRQGITPVLRNLAQSLAHEQYYILRSPNEQWVMTTLSDRDDATNTQKVLYAFSDQMSAASFPNQTGHDLTPHCLPSTHLIFQLLALKPLESLLFYEQPLPTTAIQEIKRSEFTTAIQKSLQQLKAQQSKSGRSRFA